MVTDGSPPTADAVANGGGVSSPHSRRRNLHSPWASVVRGDLEQNSSPTAIPAAAATVAATTVAATTFSPPAASNSPPVEEPTASDTSVVDSNAGGPRRPVWNRPVNGVVEPVSVMGGAISWPALSESTRPIPRSSADASRPVSEVSLPPSQVNAPIISQPSQVSQRAANSNAHGNHGGNNPNPSRQRSRNRGGGVGSSGGGGSSSVSGSGPTQGSGPAQATLNQPSLPMPPPFPVFELPFGMIPAVLDNPVRGPRASSQSLGNDHSHRRRNNYGARPRGDGQYHNRRDQDRREVHPPPQYVPPPMGYMPPPLPPGAAPFMTPPPMRVFPGQMGFDMPTPFIYVPPMPQQESFRAMPMVPPLPPMLFPPANENPLTTMIVKQIDFYFSDDNLVKDSFLRSKMDDHGWVPISLIASFRRVQQLTKDVPLILESLRHSMVVEVQGDKIRRRNEWNKWLLSTVLVNSESGSGASSSAPENVLATSLHEVSLNDAAAHANGNVDASVARSETAAAQSPGGELANGDSAEDEAVHSNSS